MLLLAQVVTLRLITADAVVGFVVGRDGSRGLEVLEQILTFMGLKFAALFHTMDTFAWVMFFNSLYSFHIRLGLIFLLKALELHAAETRQEIKVILQLTISSMVEFTGESIVHLAWLVLELPLVRTEGRVSWPAVIKIRLGLIHVILLVLVVVMVLRRAI